MNAGIGDDSVARFQTRHHPLLFQLPFFLGPNHHEVKDDANEN